MRKHVLASVVVSAVPSFSSFSTASAWHQSERYVRMSTRRGGLRDRRPFSGAAVSFSRPEQPASPAESLDALERQSFLEEGSKFKVLTCSSTACAKKRKMSNQGEFATFAAFYSRIQEACPTVKIEECPCLGACKLAPCVGVEHDDFVGPVSLEGMTDAEFAARVYHNVLTEMDVDRVWGSIEGAIHTMVADAASVSRQEGVEV